MSSPPTSILSISCFKRMDMIDGKPIDHDDDDDASTRPKPICLALVSKPELLGRMVSMFYSATVKENIVFSTRLCAGRVPFGERAILAVDNEDLPYDIYCFVRSDGLVACVVASIDYPKKVAWGVCYEVLKLFDSPTLRPKLMATVEDRFLELPKMKELLEQFQTPDPDSIAKVTAQVESVKDVMRKNIEQILSNMETIESLAQKSEDLEESSKEFYTKAKKANSRCRYCSIM